MNFYFYNSFHPSECYNTFYKFITHKITMSHGACRMSTFFHSQTGQITQLLHELNIIQQRVGIPLKLNCNKPSNKFDIIKLHSTIYLFHLSGSARQAAWLLKKKKMQFRDEEDSITEKPYLHPVNSPMPFALSWRIGCHHKVKWTVTQEFFTALNITSVLMLRAIQAGPQMRLSAKLRQ